MRLHVILLCLCIPCTPLFQHMFMAPCLKNPSWKLESLLGTLNSNVKDFTLQVRSPQEAPTRPPSPPDLGVFENRGPRIQAPNSRILLERDPNKVTLISVS